MLWNGNDCSMLGAACLAAAIKCGAQRPRASGSALMLFAEAISAIILLISG